MSDSKPSGPFRADDFTGRVHLIGDDDADHLADAANARLAPLWEALERQDAVQSQPETRVAEEGLQRMQDWLDASAAVLTAYRALRDREEK